MDHSRSPLAGEGFDGPGRGGGVKGDEDFAGLASGIPFHSGNGGHMADYVPALVDDRRSTAPGRPT